MNIYMYVFVNFRGLNKLLLNFLTLKSKNNFSALYVYKVTITL